MKQKLIYFYSFLLFVLFTNCNRNEMAQVRFRGLAADDTAGMHGLYNPERGLRLETTVDVVDDRNNPTQQLETLSSHLLSDSISLSQSYFYLTHRVGQKLSVEDFAVMQAYFDKLEELGKKSVLRFAYEKDFMGREANGPTLEQAITQIEELKPFIDKNKHLILVVQAGIIGAWGEWHSSVHGLEKSDDVKRTILKKILEIVPEDKYIQVRVPSYKNLLKESPELYRRISFHDDMIIIKPHEWDGDIHDGTLAFEQMRKETPYLPMDGELPWGFWSVNNDPDSPQPGWLVDGAQAARRFFLHHYTSLSAIHNYRESRGREGKESSVKYSMEIWKEVTIEEDFLRENKMPISDNYFTTQDGSKVKRSVFDYVRDHLGYRIELQKLTLPMVFSKTTINNLHVELINRGFATVFNQHPVFFVLIDEKGKVCGEFRTDTNPNSWQPYNPQDSLCIPLTHEIKTSFTLPEKIAQGKYRLGLWIPDGSEQLRYNSRYAIRCANRDCEWWASSDQRYGINILTEIIIK